MLGIYCQKVKVKPRNGYFFKGFPLKKENIAPLNLFISIEGSKTQHYALVDQLTTARARSRQCKDKYQDA